MLTVAHTTHSIQLFTRNPMEKKDKASICARFISRPDTEDIWNMHRCEWERKLLKAVLSICENIFQSITHLLSFFFLCKKQNLNEEYINKFCTKIY